MARGCGCRSDCGSLALVVSPARLSPRTLPSAFGLGLVHGGAHAVSSARFSSLTWAWIAQWLRLRASWELRSQGTAAGVIGGSAAPSAATRQQVRAPSFRLPLSIRFRAGAGRCSGSGRRQGRVRRGRSLLSRPRGSVGSARLRGFGGSGLSRCAARVRERGLWVGMVVRFVCVIRVSVRVSRVSLVCPGSSVSFYLAFNILFTRFMCIHTCPSQTSFRQFFSTYCTCI